MTSDDVLLPRSPPSSSASIFAPAAPPSRLIKPIKPRLIRSASTNSASTSSLYTIPASPSPPKVDKIDDTRPLCAASLSLGEALPTTRVVDFSSHSSLDEDKVGSPSIFSPPRDHAPAASSSLFPTGTFTFTLPSDGPEVDLPSSKRLKSLPTPSPTNITQPLPAFSLASPPSSTVASAKGFKLDVGGSMPRTTSWATLEAGLGLGSPFHEQLPGGRGGGGGGGGGEGGFFGKGGEMGQERLGGPVKGGLMASPFA